jgi:iodotyrosine deiodinase
MVQKSNFIPLKNYRKYSVAVMKKRSHEFYIEMSRRRSVRNFSEQAVPREVIENCIRTAASAPSGANLQPWQFVVVSDPEVKRRIRIAAEKEERAFYQKRVTEEWLKELQPLGTDAQKPFLESAPYLIVIFSQRYRLSQEGKKIKNYYVQESVAIATGMLITAIHHAGLVALTHTPSPMGFLNEILKRPVNEKPLMILIVGYPAKDARVPDIKRKTLQEIATFI